ncbi:MAG: preprotein translocase subunit SecA [Firmicutes bacterium]|nr:preprotein translocase subunit SecA [Bacillota bacterium]
MGLISFVMGSDNRRQVKKLTAMANKITAIEQKYKDMSDEELKSQTDKFRKRLKSGLESLEDILPEAFATVREASIRVLGMRHFDVQLMGGICLHQGRISEMRTGEGKTLVSTLPAYLNALEGKGVHIVTVNDYLAKRDAEWIGKIHRFLGLTVGVAISGMEPKSKREAYNCDITYATNNELGFDYLRDNMVIYKEDRVQRELNYAIVDEVDSILIDEARTPLIISGRGNKSSEMYHTAQRFAKSLTKADYDHDEKKKAINLTDEGITKAETYFNIDELASTEHTELNHHINNAIRANFVMKRDKDYVVDKGEIIIVDENTGRLMIGRRYSEGLHQAIEAKENVKVQSENKTLATITFQNYFRLYPKLSGMTGTAKTEETEFREIYSMDVVTIPTNKDSQRVDENDQIYATIEGKIKAILEDIIECTERGQPVLVGTTDVEKSEELSKLLHKRKIRHNLLNAKNHEKEAEIVAQAGKLNAVTISTNMAGRGTDIILGGNSEFMALEKMRSEGFDEKAIYNATSYFNTTDESILEARKKFKEYHDEFKTDLAPEREQVIEVGGLRIIGTERHESRRIDNQLRGRAGRQGDIGSSVFYISMEDDLARLFASDRMKRMVGFITGEEDDQALSLKMLTRGIENAQRSIEGKNYSIRRQVLEYDNVMNTMRTTIYGDRNKVLEGKSVHKEVNHMMREQVENVVGTHVDPRLDWTEWEIEDLNKDIEQKILAGRKDFLTKEYISKHAQEEIIDYVHDEMQKTYVEKVDEAEKMGVDFEEIERVILLRVVDNEWMDHIDIMDSLRRGVGLKAYGQQNPITAYKQEGFAMFDDMNERIKEKTVNMLMRVNVEQAPLRREQQMVETSAKMGGGMPGQEKTVVQKTVVNAKKNISRNDPCPCGAKYPDGNAKKYKNCCEANE